MIIIVIERSHRFEVGRNPDLSKDWMGTEESANTIQGRIEVGTFKEVDRLDWSWWVVGGGWWVVAVEVALKRTKAPMS